ncbi:MAG: hypothetical protein IJ220_05915 [Clostridia bacterium]|nr:hypothetical protein [Clostridia bacterium]
MKERVEKFGPTEIVLRDNELMLGIQQIIEDAIKKGYKKSWVINAISQRWRDMIPMQEKDKLELTDDEKSFFEKVDKFYSDYGQAFVMRASWRENKSNWENRDKIEEKANDTCYKKRILDSLRIATKSIYCIFCREDTITLQKIEQYNKKLFGFIHGLLDPYTINCALDDLYLVDDMPIYILEEKERRKYENIYAFTIECNENYREFCKKYSYRNTELNRAAMQLIWIISTYY